MVIEVGSSSRTLQHLPIGSLKSQGTNLYGEALFRVVWSESRYYLVGALHTEYDESAGGASKDAVLMERGKDPNQLRQVPGYKWLPLYPNVRSWVMEKWMSPIGFTGCSSHEMYDLRYKDPATGLLTLGPYPSRGEYVQCFTFPTGVTPGREIIIDVIRHIKAGWNYTYKEHLEANNKAIEKKEKARKDRFDDIFLDAQQAFKNKPTNIRPGKRKREDIEFKYSANDVGLHQQGFSTNQR